MIFVANYGVKYSIKAVSNVQTVFCQLIEFGCLSDQSGATTTFMHTITDKNIATKQNLKDIKAEFKDLKDLKADIKSGVKDEMEKLHGSHYYLNQQIQGRMVQNNATHTKTSDLACAVLTCGYT